MKRVFLTLLGLLITSNLSSQNVSAHNVLYINSYHSEFEWSDAIERGFKETVLPGHNDIIIYFERMDSKRFPPDTVIPTIKQSIINKYKDIRFGAIITSDDNAFNFALMLRSELFPDTPIIFSGVNNDRNPALHEKSNLTGVMENVDIRALLDMIKDIHPNVSHIAILGDSTESAKLHIEHTIQILEEDTQPLDYSVHSKWTMASLAEDLAVLPNDTVIIELAFHLDSEGTFLSFEDEKRFLETQTSFPAYSLWDNRIGYGVLGGVMTSGYIHGQQAGQLLLAHYDGTPINDLPILERIPFPKYFDYQQMVRFGISENKLPKDSEVLNYPDTFWFKYRRYLLLAITFVVFQSLLIVYLIQNIFKRRAAQSELKLLNEGLEGQVSSRTKALSNAVEDLKETQTTLVESEKMAALGGLVAGMAHKLNTPIGICNTATSILKDQLRSENSETHETLKLLETNLNFLSSFTADFRQISVDLSSEKSEFLEVGSYIEDTIRCRESVLRLANISYQVHFENSFNVETYPSVLTKIVFIFIQNSVLHGFSEPQENRFIDVSITSDDDHWYIHYRDNGKGVSQEIKAKIFEPFFTTKFGIGSGGLGLNIVYNEVVHRLKGDITIDSSWESGLGLILKIPLIKHT